MKALMTFYHSLRRNDEGQDLLEYALLVALIAIVAVGAVTTAGETVAAIFEDIAGQIQTCRPQARTHGCGPARAP